MNWLLLFSLLFPSSRTTSCRTVYAPYELKGAVKSVVETEILYKQFRGIYPPDSLIPSRTLQFSRTGDTVIWTTPSFDGSTTVTHNRDGGIVVEQYSRLRYRVMPDSLPRFRTTHVLSRYSSNCIPLEDRQWGRDSVAEFFTPQYDTAGRLILLVAASSSDSIPVRTITYHYLPDGSRTEQEEGRDDDGVYIVISTYDADDNLVREVRTRKGRDGGDVADTSVVWNYSYDRQGGKSLVARYLPGESSDTTLIETRYDDHGNWIERKSYRRDYYNGHMRIQPTEYRLKSVHKRQIEYYPD